MKRVLIVGSYEQEEQEAFKKAASGAECIFMDQEAVDEEALANVQSVIGNISPELLSTNPELEWVQLLSSGVDAYVKEDVLGENTILTSATGAYGLGIAEYMVAMTLIMMKKIPAYLENQKQGIWKDEGIVRSPFGKKVLVVGTGNIGSEFAKRMKAFGSTIVGVRRRSSVCPPEFERICRTLDLAEELQTADIVALCLPGTQETYHLFDRKMLQNCREGAIFMNVGRGNVVDTEALTDPRVYERFGGIWLDVCETEPLPKGHPLFLVPNMILTPHITGGFHLDVTRKNIVDICASNMKAWLGNGEFQSVVDRETGYCG